MQKNVILITVAILLVLAGAFIFLRPYLYPESARSCLEYKSSPDDCLISVALIKNDSSICDLTGSGADQKYCKEQVQSVTQIPYDMGSYRRYTSVYYLNFSAPHANLCDGAELVWQRTLISGYAYEMFYPGEDCSKVPIGENDIVRPSGSDSCPECCYWCGAFGRIAEMDNPVAACAPLGSGYSPNDPSLDVQCYLRYAILRDNASVCGLIPHAGNGLLSDHITDIFNQCTLALAIKHNQPTLCGESEYCWSYFAHANLNPDYCSMGVTKDSGQEKQLSAKWCRATVLAQLGR